MSTVTDPQARLDEEVAKSTTLALQVIALRLALKVAIGYIASRTAEAEARRVKAILDGVLADTAPKKI